MKLFQRKTLKLSQDVLKRYLSVSSSNQAIGFIGELEYLYFAQHSHMFFDFICY